VSRLTQLLREETEGLHGRLLLAQLLVAPLPYHTGTRIRALVLRLAGFEIGHGTVFWGMPTLTGPGNFRSRLVIGRFCWFNVGCFLDLGHTITIGDHVSVGQQVMLLTTSHEIGTTARRAAAPYTRPITIENGAWLGARSVILPGITVGAGAVVAAGAVVTKDVPPNMMVGGVPAQRLRELTSDESG
jgi:maltose O-acetyltransferase